MWGNTMGIAETVKDVLAGGQTSYRCTECEISWVRSDRCPSCGKTETVEPK